MRVSSVVLALLLATISIPLVAQSPDAVWSFVPADSVPNSPTRPNPERFVAAQLDRGALLRLLDTAPLEFTAESLRSDVRLALPLPDGTLGHFRIEESPIMEPGLAAKLPDVRTYRGVGVDDPTATTRFDLSSVGFHAIILSANGTSYIDPAARGELRDHIVYAKSDSGPAKPWECLVEGSSANAATIAPNFTSPSGTHLLTYRAAVAATGEYTIFHGGTVDNAMKNGIVPTMNRVSAIYERELSIRMTLVANNDLIVYTDPATDPYTNSSGSTMLNQNQTNLDNVIGSANYDIGHVFSTGGGGIAGLSVVCRAGNKARGVTGSSNPVGDGFDVDYVAHEMGHQFGGNHTFNGNAGSCAGGNRNGSTAYEVGSGSTIMAYAGICGSQNLQPHSDDYFHWASLQEIINYSRAGSGANCPVSTATGNAIPTVNGGPDITIPRGTPFVLTASGADADGDAVTYCWEEFDLGPAGDGTENGNAPILRSFNPTTSPSRTFPKLTSLATPIAEYGEILPMASRTMQFKVTIRDNHATNGGVNDDQVAVTISTAGPFKVTQPNVALTWPSGSTQTVTWDVANTNLAPINTASVKILLSLDSGLTYPHTLTASTPNDGSESISLPPGISSNSARVRVEAVGHIYFDISDVDFTIATSTAGTLAFSSATYSVTEGTPNVTVTVNRTGGSTGTVTVLLTTANGTATAPGDYTATSTTLVLNGGVTSANAALPITNDQANEPSENFTATLSNPTGGAALGTPSTTTVTITDDDPAIPPVAANDAYDATEDVVLQVAAPGVLGNDSDANGDPLTAAIVDTPANGAVTLNSNGSFSYTPSANFNGTDGFTYRANDGTANSNLATVTLTVAAVNDAPVAVDDSASTAEESAVTTNVITNDTDVEGNSLGVTASTDGANGTVSCNASECTYTPNLNFNGNDSYSYSVSDGNGGTDSGTVSVTVDAVNDPPVAVNDSYSAEGSSILQVSAPGVLGNDSDVEGGTLTAVLVTGVTNGVLALSPDGSFEYTPQPGFTGSDSFTYEASDGSLSSNIAIVTIDVAATIPTVASITPTAAVASGGTGITVSGTKFVDGATVTIGGVPATNVTFIDATTLNVVAPSLPPGTLNDVVVTNPGATTGTLANGYMADFLDVPTGHGFHDFVESIFRAGITAGCGGGNYCPASGVTRAQMAVFLLVAKEGTGYAPPPATGTIFDDVPANSFAAAWIEELYNRGISGGCATNPLRYCPSNTVTRAQMAPFLLVTALGSGYVPPAPAGIFGDVPTSSPFAKWIEDLFARGVTGGCSTSPPLYCPASPSTRGQMAVFLKVTFGLP